MWEFSSGGEDLSKLNLYISIALGPGGAMLIKRLRYVFQVCYDITASICGESSIVITLR